MARVLVESGKDNNENTYAKKMRELEEYLENNNIYIEVCYHKLNIIIDNKRFEINDGYTLPRLTSDEKLIVL